MGVEAIPAAGADFSLLKLQFKQDPYGYYFQMIIKGGALAGRKSIAVHDPSRGQGAQEGWLSQGHSV